MPLRPIVFAEDSQHFVVEVLAHPLEWRVTSRFSTSRDHPQMASLAVMRAAVRRPSELPFLPHYGNAAISDRDAG